jgi:hypothetical protein
VCVEDAGWRGECLCVCVCVCVLGGGSWLLGADTEGYCCFYCLGGMACALCLLIRQQHIAC